MSKLTPIQFYLSQTMIIDQISQSLMKMKTQLKAFLFQNNTQNNKINKTQSEVSSAHKRDYSQVLKHENTNTDTNKRNASSPKTLVKPELSVVQSLAFSTPKNKNQEKTHTVKQNEQNNNLSTPKQFMNYILDKVVYQNQPKEQQKSQRQNHQTLMQQYNDNCLNYLLYSTKEKPYENQQIIKEPLKQQFPSIKFIQSMDHLHEKIEQSKQQEEQRCLDLMNFQQHKKSLEQSMKVPFFGVARNNSLQIEQNKIKSKNPPIFIYDHQNKQQSISHPQVLIKKNTSPLSKAQEAKNYINQDDKDNCKNIKENNKNENLLHLDHSLYALTFSKESDRLINQGQDEKSIEFCFVDDDNKIRINKRISEIQDTKYDSQNLLNSYQAANAKMSKTGNLQQQYLKIEQTPSYNNTNNFTKKEEQAKLLLSTPPKSRTYVASQISPHFRNESPKKYLFCKKTQQAPVQNSIQQKQNDIRIRKQQVSKRISFIEYQDTKQPERPKSLQKYPCFTQQKCLEIARNPLKQMLISVLTLYPSEMQIFCTKYGKMHIKYKQVKKILNPYPDRRYTLVDIEQLGQKYLYFKEIESKIQFGKLCKGSA